MTRATSTNDKWRRRSRQEWQTVFARFAHSGLGVEPFCVREGLCETTFRRWHSMLGDEPPLSEPTSFVDAGTLKLGRDTGRFELRLDLGDGLILHLSRG